LSWRSPSCRACRRGRRRQQLGRDVLM
jgi:hypothetical protein